jgi:hypothetical protein
MAKEQGLALNPNKISGQCGRLLCCLSYEFETYCSMKKCLPKCGRKVQVEGGEGEIVEQNVLAQTVTVRLGDGKKVEVPADDLERARPAPTADAPGRQKSRGEEPAPPRERRRPAPPATAPVAEKSVDVPPPEKAGAEGESDEQKEGRKRSRRRRRPRRK